MRPLVRFLRFRPTLAFRAGLLAGALVGMALLILEVARRIHQQTADRLLAAERQERQIVLRRAIQLTSRPLGNFTSEYSQWDEMVRYLRRPNRRWAAVNIDASVETFDLSAIWVLGRDGTVVYSSRGEGVPAPAALPVAEPVLRQLMTKRFPRTFFVQAEGRVLELGFASIHPSDDEQRATEPRGWLLAEMSWNAGHVSELDQIVGGKGALLPPGHPPVTLAPTEFAIRHSLLGLGGAVVAEYVGVIDSRELAIAMEHQRVIRYFLIGGSLVVAVIAFGSLYLWVLRPLALLNTSLVQNDPGPLETLTPRGDEFGRLARLVETSFAQRAELERNLAERTRFGRDLHDGVIQRVYAAGMSLAGVRVGLRTKPAEAERLIGEVHAVLNSAIRDLRAQIAGLEPEMKRDRPFSDDVRSIVTLMQGARPFAFTLQIDDALIEQLPASVRLHLLQIVRESVSNSVRHSRISRLEIVFRREADQAALAIVDDGGGITKGPDETGGQGLANLVERTRELGGIMRVESEPGRGVRLQIAFPCPA